jgi:hypothetical protein
MQQGVDLAKPLLHQRIKIGTLSGRQILLIEIHEIPRQLTRFPGRNTLPDAVFLVFAQPASLFLHVRHGFADRAGFLLRAKMRDPGTKFEQSMPGNFGKDFFPALRAESFPLRLQFEPFLPAKTTAAAQELMREIGFGLLFGRRRTQSVDGNHDNNQRDRAENNTELRPAFFP